jgi:2-polyprenyl-3-methyl-5-hydroxy-6-metoxy-1,4-benzoquinol methylase
MEKYIEVNKSLWNGKTEIHVKTDFYDVESFKKGKSSLNYLELEALGDVKGKSILHLQCHFGMDSLSWARLGAEVTGVDLSDKAVETARALNSELGLDAEFICSDVYELKNNLDKKYDIVFTSYGVIGWLPDLSKWADVISHFLKPGGVFYMAEFHPVVWMFDEDISKIQYSYFSNETIIEEIKGTYADRDADFKHNSYGWNHSISEVLTSLWNSGLKITEFNEYPFSFYDCFKHDVIEKDKNGFWRFKGLEDKMPVMFSEKAEK